jgi:formate hydrogenlyase subunit 3/multisubunit Na+/H+ antiporter MnhD subunit
MWERQMWHLFSRAWNGLLVALSSSTLAVALFSFAVPIVAFFIRFVVLYGRAKTERRGVKEVFKGTVFPTAVAAGVTAVCWLCLFGWSVASKIYRDHQDLVSAIPRAKRRQAVLDGTTFAELELENRGASKEGSAGRTPVLVSKHHASCSAGHAIYSEISE